MISDFEQYKNTITFFNNDTIRWDKKEIRKILKNKDACKFSAKIQIMELRMSILEKQNALFEKYDEETEEFTKLFDIFDKKAKVCTEILEDLEEKE